MRRVCVQCGLKMEFEQAGVYALEFKNRAKTEPYRLWRADLFRCKECGIEILGSFGERPVAEEFEKDFYTTLNIIKNKGERIIEYY